MTGLFFVGISVFGAPLGGIVLPPETWEESRAPEGSWSGSDSESGEWTSSRAGVGSWSG